jgi:hypothetical protein
LFFVLHRSGPPTGRGPSGPSVNSSIKPRPAYSVDDGRYQARRSWVCLGLSPRTRSRQRPRRHHRKSVGKTGHRAPAHLFDRAHCAQRSWIIRSQSIEHRHHGDGALVGCYRKHSFGEPNSHAVAQNTSRWYGYAVVNGSWNLDPVGHFALTLAYKNGFAPPVFSRVNTVQAGITLKY